MNTVTPIEQKKKWVWTGQIGDLIGGNFKNVKSAFIGTCGAGEDDTLYLVTYECISVAGEPGTTWKAMGCSVEVIRFVDVNISVVERDKV